MDRLLFSGRAYGNTGLMPGPVMGSLRPALLFSGAGWRCAEIEHCLRLLNFEGRTDFIGRGGRK